jgi:hypothetical protein
MKHSGYNNKDKWHSGSVERLRVPMEKMILKGYPEYRPGDWVLWIVPDIFCEYSVEAVIGSIKIINSENQEVEINYLTRRPYPNKNIYQMSMRSGRKRLYGIPLIFKTFEELRLIKRIQLRWDIFQIMYLREDIPFDLKLTNCIVDYELDFISTKENPDFRFFTVYSKELMDARAEAFNSDEFDHATWSGGMIIIDDEAGEESELIDFTDLLNDHPRTISDAEREFFDCMEGELKPRKLIEQYSPHRSDETQWDVYWYRKKEQLRAAEVADILPEPAFGFHE